ncbi:DNA alkylation repair protein [candidate division WOR-3 bacterium]|nr:DNA alkylation repair protein [candidate division WOR-3 bacterium]
MKDIHAAVVRELKKHVETEYRIGAERYFKEGIVLHGVRACTVRRIAAESYRLIRSEPKPRIYRLCESLLRCGYSEEKTIAFEWTYRLQRKYEPADFMVFESWLEKYVSTWGDCDDLCRHAFGPFVYRFPECLPNVVRWTTSGNRWLRRGAAVVMIYSLRKGENLDAALQIADALLRDEDYLVQNGYGWMLKDASIVFPEQVLDYVLAHRREMPRRALRYAIERFNARERREAMN